MISREFKNGICDPFFVLTRISDLTLSKAGKNLFFPLKPDLLTAFISLAILIELGKK